MAFGLTAVIGIDFLDLVRERAVEDPLFRANIPPAALGEKPAADHIGRLAARLGELAGDAGVVERFKEFRRGYRYARGGFALPEAAAGGAFQVHGRGLKVVKAGKRWTLVGKSGSVPIPPGSDRLVAWIIARESFSDEDFESAFPDTTAEDRTRMLRDLAGMKVVEPA